MANNRMYLVDEVTGVKFLLAKYYPSTGWYMYHDVDKFDSFLHETSVVSQNGNGYKLEFEVEPDGNTTSRRD